MASATGTATGTATLKDSAGNPVFGEPYAFKHRPHSAVAFATDPTLVTDSTVDTDSPNGVATYQWTLPPGLYDFGAVFTGDVTKGYTTSEGDSTISFPAGFLVVVGTTTTFSVASP